MLATTGKMISPFFSARAAATAACGGVLLGTAVVFKVCVLGEVLGCSGATKGLIAGPRAEKAAFIIGLAAAGALMSRIYGGFEPMPPPATYGSAQDTTLHHRAAFIAWLSGGALLVGFGTAMGNGCTSGHGLTGLARLAPRSWVAVPTFMGVAMVTASLLGTSKVLPPDATVDGTAPPLGHALVWAFAGVVTLLLLLGGLYVLKPPSSDGLRAAVELAAGLAFGAGLSISTMVRPSKVAGFLDVASGQWDPSLAFVMGGALLVTFPFYQAAERAAEPTAVLGGAWQLPSTARPVDRLLVAGAALFGAGWGTCGMCPGPIWVVLGACPGPELFAVTAAMLFGTGFFMLCMRLHAGHAGPVSEKKDDAHGPPAEEETDEGVRRPLLGPPATS